MLQCLQPQLKYRKISLRMDIKWVIRLAFIFTLTERKKKLYKIMKLLPIKNEKILLRKDQYIYIDCLY